LTSLYDLVRRLEVFENECDLVEILRDIGATLEFDFCAHGIKAPLPIAASKISMVNNYPQSWVTRYTEQKYVTVDPTVSQALQARGPVLWSRELFHRSPEFWNEAKDHGLNHGWALASWHASGAIGMTTFSRTSALISPTELRAKIADLTWAATAIHQILAEKLVPSMIPRQPLTRREGDVLCWTADGKSTEEISIILGISARTVNFHITNAIKKLNCVNKAQATVKAIVLNLIPVI